MYNMINTVSTVAHQIPLSIGFSRQGYWSGLPFPTLIALCAVLSRSVMSDYVFPWTTALQAPLSTGILQAGIQEWVAMPSSRSSSQPRDQTQISCIVGRFFTI